MDFVGGSQAELRVHNEARILAYVRDNPGVSQQQVAQALKLTRAAVAKLIDRPGKQGGPPSGLRRALAISKDRPARLALRVERGVLLALDIGSKHIRVWVCDLGRHILAQEELEKPIDAIGDAGLALDEAARLIEVALSRAAVRRVLDNGPGGTASIAGIVIGVPFPVDEEGVVMAEGGWRQAQMPSSLWQRLGWSAEARVESDANLGALEEVEAALEDAAPVTAMDMVYVKWSTRINAAIVSGGRPHRGWSGRAGQFAHTAFSGERPPDVSICRVCGQVCLSSCVSIEAIVRSLGLARAADYRELDAEQRGVELVKRARQGERPEERALRLAAYSLGSALGSVINTLNPRLLILGGAFHADSIAYLEKDLRRGLRASSYDAIFDDVIMRSGRRTGRAAVEGGLTLGLRKFTVRYLLRINSPTVSSPSTAVAARLPA
jgi:predicted NBD/HSP70 family sugar kinase